MLRTYGVGMIGYGFIGKVHTHAHQSLPLFYDPLPAKTRLVGVCTATEESGRKAMGQAGFAFGTTDYRELIARDDIDIIHICTPNDSHRDAILDALRAGKHIYCDKPLALNTTEAEEIVRAAHVAKGVHQMTFNYRFIPAIMRARQLVEEGFLGDLYTFRAAYLHAGYIDPARPYSWRLDMRRSGGGAISDLGAHVIDLIRFLTAGDAAAPRAGEITQIQANLQTVIKERKDPKTGEMRPVEVDDMAFAMCEMAGGAIGTLEASRLATGVQDEIRLELHGSKGGIRFNLMEPNWLYAYDATTPEAVLGGERGYKQIECAMRYPKPYALGATKNPVGWLNFHIHSLFDFVNNVTAYDESRPLSPHSPTFEDGLATQRIISACQESSRLGTKVKV
ncbi:MAG: Gfo/Idh/MocA family oxidoreductase [Armatimonadetes bacterium]|nr:Gfo/Idh/MocA family oxidoreductase [Armatimonadota bacterium]